MLTIDGGVYGDGNRFEWLPTYTPSDYALVAGTGTPFVKAAVGFTRGGSTSSRAAKQETLFRALYDSTSATGFAAFSVGTLSRTVIDPDVLAFGGTLASIVIDGKTCTYKGLSPSTSSYASIGGGLRAAALTGLRVHVIGESAAATRGARFDTRQHLIVGGPSNNDIFRSGFEN